MGTLVLDAHSPVRAWAALLSNVALFGYWLYKIVSTRRNPWTNALYFELAEFRTIVTEHFDDRDKYFVTDRIPETPEELGFAPESPTPPADGYVGHMPWWGTSDRRFPKLRTPVAADPGLVAKGVVGDPQWEVSARD